MTLTLQQAIALAHKVDELYFKTYLEYCTTANIAPEGRPGMRRFSDTTQVLKNIKERRDSIEHLRRKIQEIQECDESKTSSEILSICDELGIVFEEQGI